MGLDRIAAGIERYRLADESDDAPCTIPEFGPIAKSNETWRVGAACSVGQCRRGADLSELIRTEDFDRQSRGAGNLTCTIGQGGRRQNRSRFIAEVPGEDDSLGHALGA